MAEVEFLDVVRGVGITVFADNFTSDESVGIGYGPDELWAETDDGTEMELTDDEYERLVDEAVKLRQKL